MSYQFADINGVRMHYDVQGEGPALVLIHAGIANLTMWDAEVDAFRQDFQVIRFDVRGFGETPDPAGKYTDHEDLKTLLDVLKVSKAHVLGISNGGRIAVDFTLTHPDMVEKLVLVAPGVGGFQYADDPFETRLYEEFDQAMKAGEKDKAAELEAQIWVDGPERKTSDVDAGFRKKALTLIRHTIELGIGEGEGDFARPLAAGRLGEIKAPTLLIVGEHDVAGMFAVAESLEAEVGDLKRVDMKGTAHLPPMEKPDEFNRIVLDFLQE